MMIQDIARPNEKPRVRVFFARKKTRGIPNTVHQVVRVIKSKKKEQGYIDSKSEVQNRSVSPCSYERNHGEGSKRDGEQRREEGHAVAHAGRVVLVPVLRDVVAGAVRVRARAGGDPRRREVRDVRRGLLADLAVADHDLDTHGRHTVDNDEGNW